MDNFTLSLISWTILTVVIFPLLLKISAPYGKFMREGWGPGIGSTAAWIIMEIPCVLVFGYIFFFMGPADKGLVNWIFLGIWMTHYIHRTFIYPLQIPNKTKIFPIIIVLFGLIFNAFNVFFNSYYVSVIMPNYDISWFTDIRFITGVLVFITGFIINKYSDHILFSLRKPGETGYKIPYGGMYRWVSNPHYLGEILEWTGWAIATWSLPGLSFVIWTSANLIPRAITNHKWYKSKFPDYPENRKAVIPFIL